MPGIDLPTVAQTLPGFFAGGWNVMLAPNGTAPLHMRKLGFDLRKVLEEQQVKEKLGALGAYVAPMSADALEAGSLHASGDDQDRPEHGVQERLFDAPPVAQAVAVVGPSSHRFHPGLFI